MTFGAPVGNELVVQVAVPPPLMLPAMQLVLLLQVTRPVGVTPPDTVAVNITDVPKVDGFSEEVIASVVAALLTDSLSDPELVLSTFESAGVKIAEIVFGPTGSVLFTHVTAPAPFSVVKFALEQPMFQAIVPNPPCPPDVITDAVNVTFWPKVVGLLDDVTVVIVLNWPNTG